MLKEKLSITLIFNFTVTCLSKTLTVFHQFYDALCRLLTML